jgi:hypothetical protein
MFYVYEKKKLRIYGGGRVAFSEDADYSEVDEYTTPDDKTYKLDADTDTWSMIDPDGDEETENIDGEDFIDYDGVKLNRVFMKEISTVVENVGPFLTEQAANMHIESNSYHYNKPFTYVNSLWRNYELQDLIKILFALAKKEVPSQYK